MFRAERNGILLCRPKPINPKRGQGLLHHIEQFGLKAQNLHLTEHRLLKDPINSVLDQGLLFSSATAVDALSEFEKQKRIAFVCRDLPVLAVGVQTAEAVGQLGFKHVHVGKAGMVALLNTGVPWLKHHLERQKSGSNKPIHLTYFAPKNPKFDLKDRTFASLLDSKVHTLFSTFQIDFTPLYVTQRMSELWQEVSKQLKSENNLSKIKYLSFFSQANAVTFSAFIGSENAISHQSCQTYDETQGIRFTQTRALCFSNAIADALPSNLFQSIHVCERPRRIDFLNLLRTLES